MVNSAKRNETKCCDRENRPQQAFLRWSCFSGDLDEEQEMMV